MYLRGFRGMGFVASKNVGCPAGSVPSGMIAAAGYVDCEWIPQAAPRATEAPRAPTGGVTSSVSVPTQIQTQISPQISPVFIQQQQPTGSPIGAGTAMTGATQQAGGAEMLEFLKAQEATRQAEARQRSEDEAARRADETARQEALLAEFRAASEGEAGPGLPQLMPTGGGAPPPSDEEMADDTGMMVQTAGFGGGGMAIPLIALAAAAGIFMLAGGAGKGKSGTRKKRKRK